MSTHRKLTPEEVVLQEQAQDRYQEGYDNYSYMATNALVEKHLVAKKRGKETTEIMVLLGDMALGLCGYINLQYAESTLKLIEIIKKEHFGREVIFAMTMFLRKFEAHQGPWFNSKISTLEFFGIEWTSNALEHPMYKPVCEKIAEITVDSVRFLVEQVENFDKPYAESYANIPFLGDRLLLVATIESQIEALKKLSEHIKGIDLPLT